MTSPAGAILLSTTTMFLAIAASALLLRDRARAVGPPSAVSASRGFGASLSLGGADDPPLLIRPALRCDASKSSMPLTPPTAPAAD